MQFTLILNILLFIGCYKLFGNWEIPVKLGFNPFEVVGGFPTLIDSFFDDLLGRNAENARNLNFQMENLPAPILSSKFTRNLPWKCPILEGENQCFTIVTSSECLATSQLSYEFWEDSEGNSECYHRSKMDSECRIPFQRGNLCENVVFSIKKSGNSTVFEMDDVAINTQISQFFTESRQKSVENSINSTENSNFCQNYTSREILLAGGENNTDIFKLFLFGINQTQVEKSINSSDSCTPPFPDDIFLCNCKNNPICNVPILYPNENDTFCGPTTIEIYHYKGFVYSAIATSSEDPTTSSSHSILFFDLPQSAAKSKFDLQRGRFHCPSETTCILEILYPFRFLNSLELPFQIGILIFSAIIGVFLLYGRN